MKNKWMILVYDYEKDEVNLFATFSNRDNARQVKKALNKKQKYNRKYWYFIERMQPKKIE